MSKHGFTDYLAEQVNTRFRDRADAERAEIFEFAKEIALESFKNGKALGGQRKSAPQNRSALGAGKLTPAA